MIKYSTTIKIWFSFKLEAFLSFSLYFCLFSQQLGQTQLAIDQHKSKSHTLEDQVLQLKFAMEKAQQNEVDTLKNIVYYGIIVTVVDCI